MAVMPDRRRTSCAGVLGGMSEARFLRDHWQRKPLLVRSALPAFQDPLTPEDVAGLACEDGVESRFIEKKRRNAWHVSFGPHAPERFADLPERSWTVLVQEVNRWVPGAATLLEPFAFVPNVRVDDVMVSYAAPGGGVGPHLDSYDVFLVQGLGQRRWQYHTQATTDRALVPGLDLRVLARFEPDEDEVLGPGDMLYLPPGFAHHGTAVTPCLTYSIGFRSMSIGEAWSSFAGFIAQHAMGGLIADPPLTPAENPGAIPPAMLEAAREVVRSMDTSDETIDRWFASFSTRLKPGHVIEPPTRAVEPAKILARISRGDVILRSEEGRWAFLPRPRGLWLYVGGDELEVPAGAAATARELCGARRHERLRMTNTASRDLVLGLFARGALSFGRRTG